MTGIVGAVVVALWAKRLIADTARVLLDREMDHAVVAEIREVILKDFSDLDTTIADLHVWRVGKSAYSVALVVVTNDHNLTPDIVRSALQVHEELVHVTVEINKCI